MTVQGVPVQVAGRLDVAEVVQLASDPPVLAVSAAKLAGDLLAELPAAVRAEAGGLLRTRALSGTAALRLYIAGENEDLSRPAGPSWVADVYPVRPGGMGSLLLPLRARSHRAVPARRARRLPVVRAAGPAPRSPARPRRAPAADRRETRPVPVGAGGRDDWHTIRPRPAAGGEGGTPA